MKKKVDGVEKMDKSLIGELSLVKYVGGDDVVIVGENTGTFYSFRNKNMLGVKCERFVDKRDLPQFINSSEFSVITPKISSNFSDTNSKASSEFPAAPANLPSSVNSEKIDVPETSTRKRKTKEEEWG